MTAADAVVALVFLAGLLVPDRRAEAMSRLGRLRPAGAGRGQPVPSGAGSPAAGSRGRGSASPWPGRAAALATGAAVLTGHGGPAVVLLALTGCLTVPAVRRRRAAESAQAALARDLPRAADLLATCLEAGAAPTAALTVVAAAVGGPVGQRLRPVAAALGSGADPLTSAAVAPDDPVARLVRALVRASATGAPLAASIRDLAVDERERARWQSMERARRAGVQAVGPLAACFLPAFVLVGVVPVVVGVAQALLAGWR